MTTITKKTLQLIQSFTQAWFGPKAKKYAIAVEPEQKIYIYEQGKDKITRFIEAIPYYEIKKKKVR